MLLQELPSKIAQRVQRSITWTEVETAAPRRKRLRRALAWLTRGAAGLGELRAAVVRFHKKA